MNIGELVAMLRVDDSELAEGIDRGEERMRRMGAVAATAGAAAGGALGGALSAAMGSAIELDSVRGTLTAQLGLTAEESQRYGQLAGDLYAGAYGESVGEVGNALKLVTQNIGGMAQATDDELKTVTAGVMNLAQTMEIDLATASGAVGQMIRNGMAKDATEALDLLNAGAQQGADRMGDLAEVFSEYGETFQTAGMDGATAMGVMTQAMEAGAWSSDLVADAIREFGIIAQANGSTSAEAFAAIGLDAGQMAEDVAAGGDRSVAAMDATLDALRAMPPGAERSAIAVALFGTKAEEMGDSLFAIDPSEAATRLGDFAGKAAEADAALSDTAAAKVTAMQRGYEMWSASLIATEGPLGMVAAGVANFGPAAIGMAGSLAMIGMAIGPLLVQLGGLVVSIVTTAARWALSLLGMAANAAMAVGRIIISLLLWTATTVAQGAIALASMAVTAAGYVASWILMGVQAMARAAVMAAAWIVAMGPVGWVIAAVVGLVALIIANWDTVVAWTSQAWTAVTGFITGAWNAITGFVSGAAQGVLGAVTGAWNAVSAWTASAWQAVVGFVSGAWNNITGFVRSGVDAVLAPVRWMGDLIQSIMSGNWAQAGQIVSNGVSNVINFVGALPGRILGVLGGLGNLLVNSGRALVDGFLSGIQGAWNRIVSFVQSGMQTLRNLWPFSPAKAGPFSGSGYVTHSGKALTGDFADSLREGLPGVVAAAAGVMDAAHLALTPEMDAAPTGLPGNGWLSRDQTAPTEPSRKGDSTVQVTINNPIAERASDSIGRRTRTLATLGPFGGGQ